MFRLKQLRLEQGLKRSELAGLTGVNAGTIANYENEIRQAPYELIIRFAQFFEVSTDYLLGNTSDDGIYMPTLTSHNVLTKQERELIADFRELEDTARKRVSEFASLYAEVYKIKKDATH